MKVPRDPSRLQIDQAQREVHAGRQRLLASFIGVARLDEGYDNERTEMDPKNWTAD